jgi:carbamoyl-phosphate synthase large subunit
MPKRDDIHTILVPGSGPIVIGQAAEFDYSGTQAIRALRQQGFRIVLVNSNPATVMTDPDLSDATYIEPLTVEALEAIIIQEKPDAMLPTVGGQTGLNLALALSEKGILEKYHVQLIGASLEAIKTAEDRHLFRDALMRAGLPVPRGGPAQSYEEAARLIKETNYPALVRASFAMGGSGAAWVHEPGELKEAVRRALDESPIRQAWLEESLLGWKEYELEVMRDGADNFVVVCPIENIDPMGVHTGDSITVAPAMTLTDREYQVLRDLARQVMSTVGVETGGSNVQFAIDPKTGRVVVIEMNPRVSRSSALASKATGFPIAKIASLLAVGYTLDEITNDITRKTRAAFEPSIDYVVVKIPRWSFEKFRGADSTLGPQMKSVGEAMAIGRTFPEALQKAVQSLEIGVDALDGIQPLAIKVGTQSRGDDDLSDEALLEQLSIPTAGRLFEVYRALRRGIPIEILAAHTGMDPWFLQQMHEIALVEKELKYVDLAASAFPSMLRRAKQMGFSDSALSRHFSRPGKMLSAGDVRTLRKHLDILPTFQRVDTCAAEFEAFTPYLYSAYEFEDEAQPGDAKKVLILGGGPNRIGQGIEFDYCCCQAAFTLRQMGYEIIMLNCNPETVSTDYDTSDRLYFEPMTLEHVMNVIELEKPMGVILQLGGQTPLNLAEGLEKAGVPILGTSPASIAMAEDRGLFAGLLDQLNIAHPEYGMAFNLVEAQKVAQQVGYPVLVRPSFILGGRAMAIVENEHQLAESLNNALKAGPGQPVLIDRFMEDAYEIDVDAIGDGEHIVIGAIMQHIEEAGVHSGDSACVLPPYKVSAYHLNIIREYTDRIGLALKVKGLLNAQYAIKGDVVYILEVNPRASRTIPFVSKATGINLARAATRVMVGQTLAEIGLTEEPDVDGFFVKEVVLPFKKIPESQLVLGPEMRSTGEVMGHASSFGHAFAKAQLAAGTNLPMCGGVLISVNDYDKGAALRFGRELVRMGYKLYATPGTADTFRRVGLPVQTINKVSQGEPHVVDLIREKKVSLILNTPLGPAAHSDGAQIRMAAIMNDVPLLTTLSAAAAALDAIHAFRHKELRYRSLQDHFLTGVKR